MDVNLVVLMGHLTREPETRIPSHGRQIAWFNIGINHRYWDEKEKAWKDGPPLFIKIKAFGQEKSVERLRKGSKCFVRGRLVTDRWKDAKTGEDRFEHVVIADHLDAFFREQDAPRQKTMPAPVADEDQSPPRGGDDDLPF